MQKARFYDRMVFAGIILSVLFAGAYDGGFTKAISVAAEVVFFILVYAKISKFDILSQCHRLTNSQSHQAALAQF